MINPNSHHKIHRFQLALGTFMLLLTVFHGKKDNLSNLSLTDCKWRQQRGVQANLYNFVQLCIVYNAGCQILYWQSSHCTFCTYLLYIYFVHYSMPFAQSVWTHHAMQYFSYFLYEYLMQVSDTMAECHCICQSCLPPPPTPDYPNTHT